MTTLREKVTLAMAEVSEPYADVADDDALPAYRDALVVAAISSVFDHLAEPSDEVKKQVTDAMAEQWGGHPPTWSTIEKFLAVARKDALS